MAEQEEKQNCTFFKKRKGKKNVRKRKENSNESDEDEEKSAVVKVQRKNVKNPMVQKTGIKRVKEDVKYDDDEPGDDSKTAVNVEYKSSGTGERAGPDDMGATAVLEFETEASKDAQAIFERALQTNKDLKGKEDDKLYRGQTGYAQYIEKKDTAAGNASSGMVRHGPIRAPAHLRTTIRWDYQPDICKDYKETGFCGFGDSCKFLHDRSDYKHGWQLEREFKEGAYDQEDKSKYEIDSDEDEELPFACYICRETFDHPVMTKCKHYFCEKCALAHYRKTARCFVCAEQTFGVFNPAKEIIKKMKEQAKKPDINAEINISDDDS
ncbi:E3 ubiquitin-protein ligase RNF113A-like [Hydractinia symbiolongicarpus]|uniref:E3 ubiquitin-protein ligase RNF113A-like n=1 Tax=Hydractinia symbiolongicarpus TaxID=13093 RepID=UPI00254BE769|nr:E3 ubiquitin-protein ligase RNF113A-like [Hydractinia symbiolongicarpus]